MDGWTALLPLLLLPAPGGAAEPGPRLLTPGTRVERDLSAGRRDDFEVLLRRGDRFQIEVDQRDIDLAEELTAPSGRKIIRVDTPKGASGTETLWAVAETSGRYRLTIGPLDNEASGRYVLSVLAVGPATREDRARAAAEAVHMRYRYFEDSATEGERRANRDGLARALTLWQSIGDPEQEALVWEDVARFRQASGDSRGALEAADHALPKAEAARDRQLAARILDQKGLALESVGDPRGGIAALERALELARSAGDAQGEANALHLLAWGRWNLGEYQEALDRDRESLAIGRRLHDREVTAWALNGVGLTYWALGDAEKSLGPFEEALVLWRALGDRRAEGFTLQNLGYSYWTLGATQRALAAYRQVLPVAHALGDRTAEALALNNIGIVQIELEDFAEAMATLRQALALWQATGNAHGMAITLHNLATANERLGRVEEARASWQQSLDAARRAGDRLNEAVDLAAMARLALRLGNLDDARTRIDESLAVVESVRGDLAVPGLKSSFLSSQQDGFAIAIDVYLALDAREPGRGWSARAFQISERARARSLVEGIAEARLDLDQDLPEDLRRREAEIGGRIKALEAKAASGAADRAELDRLLEHTEDEWDQLIAEMRRRTPRYASLRYPQAVSAEEARRFLVASSAIVSYSVSAERIVVFVLTPAGLSAKRLEVRPSEIDERVQDFVGLISRDDGDRWKRLGARLYGELVLPWIGELPASTKTLIVVPDEVLSSLPFEALSPAAEGSRRLVETFDVSYAPSVTALGELRTGATPGGRTADLLVVADPILTPPRGRGRDLEAGEAAFDLAALPHASAEARAIARFGGSGTVVLTGALASEGRLRQEPLERFRVLHFATHGLLDERHPSRSGLLLAADAGTDGLLTSREIYGLKLRSDLVVLSACQTGRGRILAGEGVQGLARAFFHAGARSVVATLWNVDDLWSETLMTTFYARLADGETRSEALTHAKRELLAERPALAPRSWAGFVLIGDGSEGVPLARPWWQALFRR
ncbi:MAG TPA: CHAT domain-containing tetratricopeptide repeat protein [Thermoanaerobaculia bacterium]|nr:CHAT domain-containing tetratricopeptide repeat protein [Thermoanaerobaculia bacterium]